MGDNDNDMDMEENKVAERPRTKKQHLFEFAKKTYFVPADDIISMSKTSNVLSSVEELNELHATKAPEKWMPYVAPDTLIHIKGSEGNLVYTTFSIEGTNQDRFIESIPRSVAEKNFPKHLKEWMEDSERPKPEDAPDDRARERQQKRMNALKWKPSDCTGASINPLSNKWDRAPDDEIKSLVSKPKKRPAEKRSIEEDADTDLSAIVDGVRVQSVTVDGAYKIVEIGRKVLIVSIGGAEASE